MLKVRRARISAFTKVECLCCLGAIGLLFCLALPGLGNTRSRSQQIACVDNLRLIGQAVQVWGAEHDNRAPWHTPTTEGGTKRPNKSPLAWVEFATLSNQLITPKILVCPSDLSRSANAAQNWFFTSDGGYLNTKYQNNATSYIIGLHSFFSEPNALVALDRNLRLTSQSESCGLGVRNTYPIQDKPLYPAAWTNAIHGPQGNIAVADGRVIQMLNSNFNPFLDSITPVDNGAIHLMVP